MTDDRKIDELIALVRESEIEREQLISFLSALVACYKHGSPADLGALMREAEKKTEKNPEP